MNQTVLYPGWNQLSPEQKEAVRKWINSIIKLRATTKEFLSFFPKRHEDKNSNSIDDLLVDTQFEMADSSTTLEGIRIEEIIPSAILGKEEEPIQGVDQIPCLVDCWLKGYSDCEKRCR